MEIKLIWLPLVNTLYHLRLLPSYIFIWIFIQWGFPCGSTVKESACNAGDLGLIPGLGRSPGEGEIYPLQYFGLENSVGLQRVRTRLSDFHFHAIINVLWVTCIYSFKCLSWPLCNHTASTHDTQHLLDISIHTASMTLYQ